MKLPEFENVKGPILMLNLLAYKDRAHYFDQYLPAFNRVVNLLGIEGAKVSIVSKVVASIIAPPGTTWDDIALVEYPSAAAFKKIAESDEYRDIAEPHRLAALEDLQLFMTQKFDL